jgi:hypothetical protein
VTTEARTETRPFQREWQFLQKVTDAALDCGLKIGKFTVEGDGKNRVIRLTAKRPEDDSAITSGGQTDLPFDAGGAGPARGEEHNDSRFRQGRPQIAPPPEQPPWYAGPGGTDEAGQ